MEMDKIDKNYKDKTIKVESNKKIFKIPCEPFDLYGCFYDEEDGHFLRMPAKIANDISWGLNVLKMMPSGGRIRFSTNSKSIGVKLTYDDMVHPFNTTDVMVGGMILLEENDNGGKYIRTFYPKHDQEKGYEQTFPLNGEKIRNYTLYLPNYVKLSSLEITLEEGCFIGHGKKYRDDIKPILYYGGSFTEGFCATRPDNSYEGFISKWTNTNFLNLGFTGNSKGEPKMADYLSTLECSFFVFNLDYNCDSINDLRERHLPLYQKFRKTHPNTPIIFYSFPAEWEATKEDDNIELRREVVFKTYKYALEHGDTNVFCFNGNDFFQGFDRSAMQIDGDHANDLGFYIFAKKLYKQMKIMFKKVGVEF